MRYFRREQGSPVDFVAYYEFEGRWVVREIQIYPETTLLLHGFDCCDLSLDAMAFKPEEKVSSEVFLHLWQASLRQPHGTSRMDSPLLKPILKRFFGIDR